MAHLTIWIIAVFVTAGIIIRPFKITEAVWAVVGAVLLILFGQLSLAEAWNGVNKGTDVYLFLTGMMLLAETCREEHLFDWLAAHATRLSRGSAVRLFGLIYLVGVVITALMSNDATAVVLTPAVAAAVKAAKAKEPLPYLLICAFIANAASFILPVSNPANLVIYGSHLPPLLQWLPRYLLPSALSVGVTYAVLYITQRKMLKQTIETNIEIPELGSGGKAACWGIGGTTVVLLTSSAFNIPLGLPTAVTGIITAGVVLLKAKKSPLQVVKGVAWAVLFLVAGLFVIVEALNKWGVTGILHQWIQHEAAVSAGQAAWKCGLAIAYVCNMVNNLPAGLIAGSAVQTGHIPEMVKSAVLIGVDLGPNLSVTGSLATILWLTALRREGQSVSARQFLKLGVWVMTAALIFALLGLSLTQAIFP